MKRILNLIASAFLAIFIVSCTQTPDIKIGYSLGPKHARWQKDKQYLREYVEKSGGMFLVEEAQGDADKQITQAKKLIDQGIQVLIITPENSTHAKEIVDYANEKNVKVIAYDRIVRDCNIDYYISFNSLEIGRLQADYLTKVKPTGNFAILGGSMTDYNSIDLNLGQFDILQPLIKRGDINIVLDKFVDSWDPNIAYDIIDQYLSGENDELDAIIASNDVLAGGAIKALDKHGLAKKVLVSGQDADLDACKRIVEGTQTMTVYKRINALAATAAKTATELAQGKEITYSQTTIPNGKYMINAILAPGLQVVNIDNIRMTIIAEGFLDENEVFQ